MASVVFILGAGSSKQAGGPLMADFLDVADMLWKSGSVGDKTGDFERVFKAIGGLQSVHSKAELDLANIESVFATFELARIINKLPGSDPTTIERIISSLKELIVVTLEQTIRLPISDNHVNPPPPYNDFVSLIRHVRDQAWPRQSVAVITFNYDMALDFALNLNREGPNYCLEGSASQGIPLLKLHGSLNWAFCPGCESVVPWHLHQYFSKYSWGPFLDSKHVTFSIGSQLGTFEHCGKCVPREPVLVPPTWNKAQYQQALSPVWQRATKELEEAEHIFVIGYSLPPTDPFFRLLYALGSVGNRTLKRIWVYNPDPNPDVDQRFRSMLGPGAIARYQYIQQPFHSAVGLIRQFFPKRSL